MNIQREWVYKNQQKVYINNDITRNEDKAIDYEMEAILAGLHTDSFNEDAYYQLKYDRFYHQ
jgi:hypothetical protein